jgi:hypothetical protein
MGLGCGKSAFVNGELPFMKLSTLFLVASAVLAGSGTGVVQAAMCNGLGQLQPFCLTDTVTWNGSAVITDPYGASSPVNSVAAVSSYFLGDQFNPGSGAPIDEAFPNPSVVQGSGGPWNFYDSFVFTLSGNSSVSGALISFSNGFVGISDLQARIFEVSGGGISTNGQYDAVAASNLANPPMSGTTVLDAWTPSELGNTGYYAIMLNQQPLSGGNEYVLQLRGEVGSSGSGSYSGTLSFVPLPGTLALLLSGLGVLVVGVMLRQRRPDARIAATTTA